jgi:hypothetical protein
MDSPFAKIFLAIMARIQSQLPEIKHIDHDLGQLEGTSIRPAIAFPCILVDFKNFTADNLGASTQMVQGDVIIKLAFAQYVNSSNTTEPLWREYALGYYDLEWKLHKALHNWSPGDEFGYLTRAMMDSDNKPQAIRVRPLTYKLEFEDNSTEEVSATTPTPPMVLV